MLRLVEEHNFQELISFNKNDVFYTRILSYALSYGVKFPFALFWIQTKDSQVTAVVSKIDEAMTISCKENADFEELKEFILAVGFGNIFCDEEIAKQIGLHIKSSGYVMCHTGAIKELHNHSDISLEDQVDLKDVYDIIQNTQNEYVRIHNFDAWFADTSYRIRHATARFRLLRDCDKPVSCAGVVADAPHSALIGAVATLPECRGKGYAGFLVSSIIKELKSENKTVYLCRAENENYAFYTNLGFENSYRWCQTEGNL